MNSPFFILSMPRSRSAWLANLLTTPTTWCGHDVCHSPLGHFNPPAGFARAGAIGSDLFLCHDELRARYPGASFAVLVRDHLQVADSLTRIGLLPLRIDAIVQIRQLEQGLIDLADRFGYPQFSFDRLTRGQHSARRIWEWAFEFDDDLPWNQSRWEMLEAFNVQVQPDILRARRPWC